MASPRQDHPHHQQHQQQLEGGAQELLVHCHQSADKEKIIVVAFVEEDFGAKTAKGTPLLDLANLPSAASSSSSSAPSSSSSSLATTAETIEGIVCVTEGEDGSTTNHNNDDNHDKVDGCYHGDGTVGLLGPLPEEMVVRVCSDLDAKELVTFSLLSKAHHAIANENTLWKAICLRWAITLQVDCSWKGTLKQAIEEQKRAAQLAERNSHKPNRTTITFNAWRQGSTYMIKDRPCKLVEKVISRAGRRGISRARLTGIDIFTGKKYEEIIRIMDPMVQVNVTHERFELVDIAPPTSDSGDRVFTLLPTGDENWLDLPKDEAVEAKLRGALSNHHCNAGPLFVVVLRASASLPDRAFEEQDIIDVVVVDP